MSTSELSQHATTHTVFENGAIPLVITTIMKRTVMMCFMKWLSTPWMVFSRLWSQKSSEVLTVNRNYRLFMWLGLFSVSALQQISSVRQCFYSDSEAEAHLNNHSPTALLHKVYTYTLPSQSGHVPAWLCSENPQAELSFSCKQAKKNCWDNTQKILKT